MAISKPLIVVAVSAAAGIALYAAYKTFGGGGGGGGGFWSYGKKRVTPRFAEPAYDTPVAWGPNGTADKLGEENLEHLAMMERRSSLSWGSRTSSSTSNSWGSSAVSSNADGSSVSPSGRSSSGGGLSRPSTAGSDRHEPSTTTWGPNFRPSSASGVLTSNQSSLTSSRPLSAETRPGSAHLSRFAEPAYDTPVAWGPNGTADKLSVPSKANDFSLSSGDFPTLASEKDNSGKSSEQHDQGSHVRPGSGAGRTAPAADRNAMAPADHKSGTVDTWTRDSSHHFEDGVRPSADNWQHGDPQQYINPNIPPQHFDAWRGPPMNAPPASVRYRGPPPGYPPVPHGRYPMEPYHYYRPQLAPNLANSQSGPPPGFPPNLANSQSGPPPGFVPRGHHPRNGDFYRPQMHEPFIRPGMPIRPGFYPGPVPYDGYYGPPMIYNPNDRDMQFMGMPPGPHGPPVYNMGPPQNPSELHDPHFRSGGRRSVGNKRPRNASPPWRQDDKDGHYVFAIGDNLTPRYKIHGKMGEGTFGQVFECWDKERKEMVAIKILRGIKKYCEAAMIEIDVLQQLGKHDKGGNRCVQLRNWFDYRNHICIVFEKLGPSLYDFLRENNYRSYPIDVVREIGRQLLECIAFMHDLRLIHTDLKPENILLVTPEYVKVPDYKGSSRSQKDSSYSKRVPKSSAIKVIDFGSTTYDRQDQSYIVSTRPYRAPEAILGLGWSYPCDIWSVGCILVELCSGEALFQTHENLEHLAMMERVLGQLPMHMLKKADRHAEKYVRKGRLDWPEGAASRDSIKAVTKLPRLQNLIKQHVDHSAGDLIHLLQGLLKYDPSERVTARAALRHPFFTRDHLGSF